MARTDAGHQRIESAKTVMAYEPDWEEGIKIAERDAWAILNLIYEWGEVDGVSASKIVLTAQMLYERAVSNLHVHVNGYSGEN